MGNYVIDMNDLICYINNKTDIKKDLIEIVLKCEEDYLVEKGIATRED